MRLRTGTLGKLTTTCALVGSFLLCRPLIAADAQFTLRPIFERLIDKMYVVGETAGQVSSFNDAVEGARQEIRDGMRRSGDAVALVERSGRDGATPLMVAARYGYTAIVEELLEHPAAVREINATDSHGLTAWAYANFAIEQSAWICNPHITRDPFRIVPLLVIQPYYRQSPASPYRRIREMLEAAGAVADMSAARETWLSVCVYQAPETRARIVNSIDLLDTIVEEANRELDRRLAERRREYERSLLQK